MFDEAAAVRELGCIERTLFALDWMQNVKLRRRVQIGLNKQLELGKFRLLRMSGEA